MLEVEAWELLRAVVRLRLVAVVSEWQKWQVNAGEAGPPGV